MTRSVEEQMADIERRMKQLRARKQRIVARENAKARKRRTHLIIRLGGILSNEGVLGYDEGVWNDECFASIFLKQFLHYFSAAWAAGFQQELHHMTAQTRTGTGPPCLYIPET